MDEEQEKEKQQQLKMVKDLTLEECLSASPPGYAYEQNFTNGGGHEYLVLKQLFDSVYPAISGEDEDYSFSRISTERLLKVEEIDRREMGVSSLSRIQSVKVKKSVSFRLPEEADIIRYHQILLAKKPSVSFRFLNILSGHFSELFNKILQGQLL